ncbi:ELMO domain-containing protein A-like isoform X1 [Cynara cardunculus var. scolymus]|uniref:ELMO domain-containing protein A-like isoform X1 n=2 Tax=Cynara cardunculus var. scolymus TaxID=59895 RepID=UPI000D62D144|nr:ELMO domain-containing protein A-like isoform X1 [Cynara cardunculus var. scolymus]
MRFRPRKCIPSCSSHHKVDEDDYPWRLKKGNILKLSHEPVATKSRLAQCITDAMFGSRTLIGEILIRSGLKGFGSDKYSDSTLSPMQEERLQRLQERLHIQYDEDSLEHQKALIDLWHLAYPDVKLEGLISEQWKDMGWQGANPSTDFRGCGFISLENLLFFAKTFPAAFHRLLHKQCGNRATWEYPFAVAGINITFMLIQMLDLYSVKPRSLPGANFLKLLEETEEAFDILYCIAFAMMDAQWLAMRASYMEFKEVLKVTRTQLERELSLEDIYQIQDLPAYNILYS